MLQNHQLNTVHGCPVAPREKKHYQCDVHIFLIGGFKSWFCVVSFYVKTIVRPAWTTKEWKIVQGPIYRFDL